MGTPDEREEAGVRTPPAGGAAAPIAGRRASIPSWEGPLERPASRRQFSEPIRGTLKDVDSGARARRLWGLIGAGAGSIIGFWAGLFVLLKYGGPLAILYPFVGALVAGALAYAGVSAIVAAAGGAAGTLYNPSGASVPYKRQYSYPASLAARGEHEDALVAYELAVAENPGDPEPYLRIARLLRDELGRYEDAARWFRKVRTETVLAEGQEILVSRELIELYRTRLDEPLKATPELARLAERYAGTPDGEWAARELAEAKEEIRARQAADGGPATEPAAGP